MGMSFRVNAVLMPNYKNVAMGALSCLPTTGACATPGGLQEGRACAGGPGWKSTGLCD